MSILGWHLILGLFFNLLQAQENSVWLRDGETFVCLSFRVVNLLQMKVPLQLLLRRPRIQRKVLLLKGMQKDFNILLIQHYSVVFNCDLYMKVPLVSYKTMPLLRLLSLSLNSVCIWCIPVINFIHVSPCAACREKRDSSPPRSLFYRVLRAAFPLPLLLLFLLLLPCLIPLSESEPGCTGTNNFARSFYPMLRYTNGPPPTWPEICF